ncbi:Putative zinc metalloprotease Rip3 [Anaerolineae bacterium]|nr:Putative zinc metalloprotease Rip3 [Anaerolineae bacterium]
MSLTRSIPLGRILGIPLGLDYSWFLIFALVTWSLAGSYFPGQYPGWGTGLYWAIGLATSLLFFASVVLHELGHSVIALRNGIPVRSITLFIFGGVAQIGREPGSPGVEFRVAIAGPIVSFALAGLFGALGWFAASFAPLAALATYLAYINASLGLFNLIPGFPLDGGRVFRAIVWRVTHSFRRATEIAGAAGNLFAWLFIFWGVWQMFDGNFAGGLWIAFIGWFLQNAATASVQQMTLERLLTGHTVGEIMTRECPTVAPEVTLEQLVHDHILTTGRRFFPVARAGRVEGLLTLHHVKEISRDRWATTTVAQAMTPLVQLRIAHPGDGLWKAMQEMTADGVNQLPVIDAANGELAGVLARDNVLTFVRTLAEVGV